MFDIWKPEYKGIDPTIISSLVSYGRFHTPVNGFCRAVLSNDLETACAMATPSAAAAMWRIAMFVYKELPEASWGSPAKVSLWISKGAPK